MNRHTAAKYCFAVALGSAALLSSGVANATSFTFSDEYYVSSLTEFHTLFGSTATGYNTAGIYQRTNTTTPIITQLTSHGTGYQSVPGEFVPNTTPNASTGLLLNGWSQFLSTNGQQLNNGTNSVFQGPNNSVVPGVSGTGLNFQYLTNVTSPSLSNGTVTAFNVSSIALDSSFTAVGFVIEALLGGVVVDTVNESLNFATGTKTVNLNWTDVDTIVFTDIGGSAGTLVLQGVNLTPYTAAVPEPASLALLGTGLVGLGLIRRRRS